MSIVENLFAQIFDRKMQIIENLKYHKQLHDQHLLSKLVIQDIPPPTWILNSDSHSSSSDLTVLNKEELISGLLLPRPGPFAYYHSGPCFLHDKPIIAAAESGYRMKLVLQNAPLAMVLRRTGLVLVLLVKLMTLKIQLALFFLAMLVALKIQTHLIMFLCLLKI